MCNLPSTTPAPSSLLFLTSPLESTVRTILESDDTSRTKISEIMRTMLTSLEGLAAYSNPEGDTRYANLAEYLSLCDDTHLKLLPDPDDEWEGAGTGKGTSSTASAPSRATLAAERETMLSTISRYTAKRDGKPRKPKDAKLSSKRSIELLRALLSEIDWDACHERAKTILALPYSAPTRKSQAAQINEWVRGMPAEWNMSRQLTRDAYQKIMGAYNELDGLAAMARQSGN